MKLLLTLFLLLGITAVAQEKKEEKPKRLTFQPGAKTPDEMPSVVTRQETPPPAISHETPEQLVADFFGLLGSGKIDDAYAKLTNGSKIIEKPDDLRVLKQKTKQAIELFGAIV